MSWLMRLYWDSNSLPASRCSGSLEVDLLGELFQGWAAILRPQKPIRQGKAEVFKNKPSHR